MRLAGKAAIITGGASGIGKATAKLFAAQGANIILADLNVASGEQVADECVSAVSRCIFLRTDVTCEDDISALVARAIAEFGRLDVTFNNAGVPGPTGCLENMNVDDWDRTVAICLRSVFLGIKHSIAPMRSGGGGSIISTASIAGLGGWPSHPPYAAAKAGVINLTQSAAVALGPSWIRVNAIAPGGISTPLVHSGMDMAKVDVDKIIAKAQPIPLAGQPEDIAESALFLAGDGSRFITGHTLVVDGGAVAPASPEAKPLEMPLPSTTHGSYEL